MAKKHIGATGNLGLKKSKIIIEKEIKELNKGKKTRHKDKKIITISS